MFKHVQLSSRIIVGFAALVVLLLFVAISGITVLQQTGQGFQQVVDGKLQFSNEVQSLRAEMGNLRRYEKDYFINLADAGKRAEYLGKWQASMDKARGHLQAATAVSDSAGKARIASLQQALAAYAQGVVTVAGQIDAAGVATTQDANKAMEPFKPAIHSMESQTQQLVVKQRAKVTRFPG